MKNSKRILFVLALAMLVIMSVVLVACNNNSSDSKTLIVGTSMPVKSLNRLDATGGQPGYNFSMLSATVSQLTPFAKIDGKYRALACDYQTSEGAKTVTVTLREGFTWHDGTPLTIDDVEFTLSTGFSKLTKDADYAEVKKEGNSLVYTLCTPESKFLETVASKVIVPKHLFDGKTKDTLSDADSVIGAGPFKFEGYDKDAGTLTFTKYAKYPSAKKIAFDKVVFRIFQNEEVLVGALKAKEIDMVYNYAKGLSPAVVESLKTVEDVKLYVDNTTRAIPKSLFFNNQKVTDARVRKAIALSIDFDKIRTTFGSEQSKPSRQGVVAPTIFGYKETAVWQRDLEAAKALLKEAGYSETKKFEFKLLVNKAANDTQYAKLLKTQIEENGMVNVTLDEKGKDDWVATYKAGEHMADLVGITDAGYSFEAGYATRYTLAPSTSMMPGKTNPACHGQMLVEDKDGNLTEYGKVLKAMIGARTDDELKVAAGKYQDFMVKNVVFVPMFYDEYTQAYSSRLDGLKLDTKLGLLNIVGFETLTKSEASAK